jgi:hypothetical protein
MPWYFRAKLTKRKTRVFTIINDGIRNRRENVLGIIDLYAWGIRWTLAGKRAAAL